LRITSDPRAYALSIVEKYFPEITPDERDKYLLYFAADRTTMVSLAIAGGLCGGEEERSSIDYLNKSCIDGTITVDDKVYMGNYTFEVNVNNTRLNADNSQLKTFMRLVYHGCNRSYTSQQSKELLYGNRDFK
jgi:hypothetical protein